MLMQHKAAQDQEKAYYAEIYQDNGYIFAMPLGTCVEPNTMRDALNYLLAAAGVGHANFHALRHTFATRAIENGVNVKTLSDILGHSQVQITMDLYCHTSLDLMRDSMNKLAGVLNEDGAWQFVMLRLFYIVNCYYPSPPQYKHQSPAQPPVLSPHPHHPQCQSHRHRPV